MLQDAPEIRMGWRNEGLTALFRQLRHMRAGILSARRESPRIKILPQLPDLKNQKSSRKASWIVRAPSPSPNCTELIVPNDPEFAAMAGVARLTWFGRLVNVLSKRSRVRSVKAKFLARPKFQLKVPGPVRIPTPELPNRPIGAGQP